MPIKPENRARYPKDWKEIRAEVLARAGNRCEMCGLKNKLMGYRDESGQFHDTGEGLYSDTASLDGEQIFQIVLTIAHLDHMPENCGEPGSRPNLRAWCQKCHLNYDQAHHLSSGRKTRNMKKGQMDMDFPEGDK